MEVAGAVDSYLIGQDIGMVIFLHSKRIMIYIKNIDKWKSLKLEICDRLNKVCDMEEPLEIPIINDLTMVLGSISQVIRSL